MSANAIATKEHYLEVCKLFIQREVTGNNFQGSICISSLQLYLDGICQKTVQQNQTHKKEAASHSKNVMCENGHIFMVNSVSAEGKTVYHLLDPVAPSWFGGIERVICRKAISLLWWAYPKDSSDLRHCHPSTHINVLDPLRLLFITFRRLHPSTSVLSCNSPLRKRRFAHQPRPTTTPWSCGFSIC